MVKNSEGDHGHAEYCRSMERLGRRTAELHAALATPSNDPAFDPVPLTGADVDRLRQRLRQEFGQLLDTLEGHTELPMQVRDDLERVVTSRREIETLIDSGMGPLTGLFKTRHHGDLHLGQVLVSENDFIFIDFEGEPARGLEERRAKHSPLRDVAGMLRSFDYAAHVAIEHIGAELHVETVHRRTALERWQQLAAGAFRDGYLQAEVQVPLDDEAVPTRERLLQLFVVEKLLYEIRYELDNRPNWLHIPLHGLASLARQFDQSSGDFTP